MANLATNLAERTTTSFSTSIPFDSARYMSERVITGATAFTPSSVSLAPGGSTLLRIIADGTNAPTFATSMVEHNSSAGYDNRPGILNTLYCWYDGATFWYAWGQQVNATVLSLQSITGITHSNGVYTYASGGLAGSYGGNSTLSLAASADGLFQARLNSIGTSGAYTVIGVKTSSTAATYTTLDYAAFPVPQSNAYQVVIGGVGGNAPNVVPLMPCADGDVVRVGRVGSTLYFEVSKDSGGTFTRIDQRTGQTTARLWMGVGMSQAASFGALTGRGLS